MLATSQIKVYVCTYYIILQHGKFVCLQRVTVLSMPGTAERALSSSNLPPANRGVTNKSNCRLDLLPQRLSEEGKDSFFQDDAIYLHVGDMSSGNIISPC